MDYDTWLMRQAEYYCTPCEPTIVSAEQVYEADGYSMDYIYNCDNCDNEECEYWKEHNN